MKPKREIEKLLVDASQICVRFRLLGLESSNIKDLANNRGKKKIKPRRLNLRAQKRQEIKKAPKPFDFGA